MFDLKEISPIKCANLGIVVTILVFTSACAHELLVRPSNNDSGITEEISQATPEPGTPALASSLSDNSKPVVAKKKSRLGKKQIAKHKYKSKKLGLIARNKTKKHKSKQVVTQVASVNDTAPKGPAAPPAMPAPEIAPPSIPAPLASAGVQTEIEEEGSHIGLFVLYGLGALAVLGLIYIAPRARRLSRPKRKLVYNG